MVPTLRTGLPTQRQLQSTKHPYIRHGVRYMHPTRLAGSRRCLLIRTAHPEPRAWASRAQTALSHHSALGSPEANPSHIPSHRHTGTKTKPIGAEPGPATPGPWAEPRTQNVGWGQERPGHQEGPRSATVSRGQRNGRERQSPSSPGVPGPLLHHHPSGDFLKLPPQQCSWCPGLHVNGGRCRWFWGTVQSSHINYNCCNY